MSVYTTTSLSVASILKSPGIRSTSGRRVRFCLPECLKTVLLDFVNKENLKAYEELIQTLRGASIDDKDLLKLLEDLKGCIPLLDQRVRHFVEAVMMMVNLAMVLVLFLYISLLGLLNVRWTVNSPAIHPKQSLQTVQSIKWVNTGVVQEYQEFLLDLLSAHNYYTKFAVFRLVAWFMPSGEEEEEELYISTLTEEDQQTFENIHNFLRLLLKVIPMSCNILVDAVADCFPYMRHSAHRHLCYIYNILKITEYQPQLRSELLHIIINRLVSIDVSAPKEDILDWEEMDDMIQEDGDEMKHLLAKTLDVAMLQLMNYIHKECHNADNTFNVERTRSLYNDLLAAFEQYILPTYGTHHIQFLIFYLCSFRISVAEAFLGAMWRKVLSPSMAPVMRSTAVMYIASLLARAIYISVNTLKIWLLEMSTWIHSYINNQDGLEITKSDIKIHSVFYAVCQSLFYVIAFRHRDLFASKKNLTFLQSLNLSKMVTCRLNPLRVCLPVIVQNFASVTRMYQLTYCYTVIEHNARRGLPVMYLDDKGAENVREVNSLETFFPFDPYILRRSGHLIQPLYREYPKLEGEESNGMLHRDDGEEDDFLAEQSAMSCSPNGALEEMFSYGTSPGFKHAVF